MRRCFCCYLPGLACSEVVSQEREGRLGEILVGLLREGKIMYRLFVTTALTGTVLLCLIIVQLAQRLRAVRSWAHEEKRMARVREHNAQWVAQKLHDRGSH